MDCREQRLHARGVHATHDTSRMGSAMVKQEEETGIVAKEVKKFGKKERG